VTAREEPLVDRVLAAALAAAAWVVAEPIALLTNGAMMVGDGDHPSPPAWLETVSLLGPMAVLGVAGVVAARRHRAWPLGVALLVALGCAALPVFVTGQEWF
jgi:hypothetical protein